MKNFKYVPALVLLLMAAITTQAAAQFDLTSRLNLVLELDEESVSQVDGTFGTGLNNASGKTNIVALSYEGLGSNLSYAVRAGYLLSGVNDLTLGASVAAPIKQSEGSAVSIQLGLDWYGFDAGITSINVFNFPFGLGLQKTVDSGEADITLWAFPNIQFAISSGGGSTNTNTNFGASAGAKFDLDNAWALHAETGYTNTSGGDPLLFSVGAAYELGSM